jgi:hypothetical protein
MWTWLFSACGLFLLLAWAKQVSSYVLGFSLTDRKVWRRLWSLIPFGRKKQKRHEKPRLVSSAARRVLTQEE